jgi:diacylglycerol kinase (ATP)
MTHQFKISDRVRSFRFAGQGVWWTLRTQHNAWIHATATILALLAGLLLHIGRIEWCLVIFACAAVWGAEMVNTAIEHLGDVISKDFHPGIGRAKDAAAGAVLIAAGAAVVVGILVFGPHLLARI